MKIILLEADLNTVLRYYADAFKPQPDKKLEYDKAFVDTAKGVVIFRMWESNK